LIPTEIQSYYHLVDWLATFNESGHGHPLCLIVGNKVDLRDLEHSHDAIDVNFITNRQLKRLEKYEHVDVSAKDGVGVEELFMRVLAGVH
jgi:predicted GTPase